MAAPWDLRRRVDKADFADAEFVTVKDLRTGLAEILNRVAYGGEQMVVRRHGRPLVAIAPTYDLQACQALEAESIPKVRAFLEMTEDDVRFDEGATPWDEAAQKYGLW